MKSQRTTTALDLPLALFLLSAILALLPAYDRNLSLVALIVLCLGVLIYGVISRLATSHIRKKIIAGIIVSCSTLLSIYFITQYNHLGYTSQLGIINQFGTYIAKFVPKIVFWSPTDNSVATFLESTFFVAIALALTDRHRVWWVGWLFGAGLIALGLLMSTSRGAWLAVAVASGLWLAIHWRPAQIIAIVGLILVLGLVVYVVIQRDITTLNQIPIVSRYLAPFFIRPDRLEIYRNSLYLVQDFPLTGVGLGKTFTMMLSEYALLIQVPYLTYSHNLYLETWLQLGLVGISTLLWLIAALLYTALGQIAHTTSSSGLGDAEGDLIYESTWIGLIAIIIHGLTDARQYVDLWCWFPFFGLLGLNAATLLRRKPTTPKWQRFVFPAGVVSVFLSTVLLSLLPIRATWHANMGGLTQARADLVETLDDQQREHLQAQAVGHYERALDIEAENRTALQRLGIIALNEREFDTAVERLEAAYRVDPNNTTTHKALGLVYTWVGELDKAEPLLKNQLNIIAELTAWGNWWNREERPEVALNAYRISLRLKPDQPNLKKTIQQLETQVEP